MRNFLRRRIARLLNRLPGQCSVDLALWATRNTTRTTPWSPRSRGCEAMCVRESCRSMGDRISAEPQSAVHFIGTDMGVTSCCRRTPFELPRGDRLTDDPWASTCRTSTRGGAR
ncbi:hypothetical protein ACTOB_001378 [Actinoplanes oblitus]|uniref:Uncharacterized protein n=1 Tax=Actinoplanes oblitus TaxID=3040509 RepID=A0ABY8WIX2_9ACTN|nr:hypothetical protein [Actinoplanes oblitus]WIM97824.1 hypothetical protein ACTOB_001378 [Actinoplanes oblitus]